MITKRWATKRGFTIVELVVVVTVIALLATITMFAFGSWRKRTATTEVTSALNSLASSLQNEVNFNNVYPSTVPDNYKPSSKVTITYKSKSSGTAYCVKGASTAETSVVLYITNTNPTPSKTTCS